MIFSSYQYILFFTCVLVVVALLRRHTYQNIALLLASYFFYAWWDWRFLIMLIALSVVNYYVGRRIETATVVGLKNRWLTTAIVFDLGILGFFKYYKFFVGSADTLLAHVGVSFPLLNVVLPIGISFMVFEVMSYTIDIYRKDSKSADTLVDLALLVAFFPHLIAGPILKPKQFLPQFRNDIVIRWSNLEQGISIFVLGLVKKVLIANNVAPFADRVFSDPHAFSSGTLWLAVIAYAIQIYADFSGYSDMAIGSAKCLGYDIPRNFNFPYVSRNITEFWRRWHISLSTWLREYLYFSLGGNRKGHRRTYVNLMIVMLLGGLWHGANWTFVVWGGMHGVALAIHKAWSARVEPLLANTSVWIQKSVSALSIATTIVFVLVTWVFFRATATADYSAFQISSYMVGKMFGLTDGGGTIWYCAQVLFIFPIFVLSHYLGNYLRDYPRFRLTSFRGAFTFFFMLELLLIFAPTKQAPFIYFQF